MRALEDARPHVAPCYMHGALLVALLLGFLSACSSSGSDGGGGGGGSDGTSVIVYGPDQIIRATSFVISCADTDGAMHEGCAYFDLRVQIPPGTLTTGPLDATETSTIAFNRVYSDGPTKGCSTTSGGGTLGDTLGTIDVVSISDADVVIAFAGFDEHLTGSGHLDGQRTAARCP